MSAKKIKNPKFQLVQSIGQLTKMTIQDDQLKEHTSYIIESDILTLNLLEHSISLRLSENKTEIEAVYFRINEQLLTISTIRSISDFLDKLHKVEVPDYWEDSNMQFLVFLFIRIVIYVLSAQKVDGHALMKDHAHTDLLRHINHQKQLANIFLYVFESSHIKTSSYVLTQRAEHLLMLGLDPREQYTPKDIKNITKQLLKAVHPDAPLGDTDLFKKINTAARYLK